MSPAAQTILKKIEEHSADLRGFGVQKLALFGSAARGEVRPESDLDFLVDFERVTFDGYMDLKFFLENLYSRKVDLVISKDIKPRLRASILSEAVHAPGF